MNTSSKIKYRPVPLSTIQLQKLGTSKLKMSSHKVMEVAEKLYNNGFISYPRTETDSFISTINLQDLVKNFHSGDYSWYAKKLLDEQKFKTPRNGGHDDKAHPPIHPVKNIDKQSLTVEEQKVYDLITRHFLACCSEDAKGMESSLQIQFYDEFFSTKGLIIKEANFLEIYSFEKWSENQLPNVSLHEELSAAEMLLGEGKTTAPTFLTETELITLMDKHGIGTDATIHEHIKTVLERGYCVKQNFNFIPTFLGVSLVDTYSQLGFSLSKPDLRAKMEGQMTLIANGTVTKSQVVNSILQEMEQIYLSIEYRKQEFMRNLKSNYDSANQCPQLARIGGQSQGYTTPTGSPQQQRNINSNERTQRINRDRSNNNQANSQVYCFKCKKQGHVAPDCPNNFQSAEALNENASNNTSNIVCYRCNQPGHYANKCPQMAETVNKKNNKIQQPNFGTSNQTIKQPQPVNRSFQNESFQQQPQPKPQLPMNGLKCYKCGESGHFANNCTGSSNPSRDENQNGQQKKKKEFKTCQFCGKKKHSKDSDCPGKAQKGG